MSVWSDWSLVAATVWSSTVTYALGVYVTDANAVLYLALLTGIMEQYDAAAGVFTIVPNYRLVEARVSHNERMLRQITEVIEDRVGADVQEYTIGGRRMVKIPVMELLGLQAIYESRVAQDRRPGRTGVAIKAAFGPSGGTIPYDIRLGAGFNVDSY